MFGEREVQVIVDSRKCGDSVVNNILVSHTDVSETNIVVSSSSSQAATYVCP